MAPVADLTCLDLLNSWLSWLLRPETLVFCSSPFLVFFGAVFAVYWLLPWPRTRVYLLLVASFAFYASWNRGLALLVCGTAALDYFLARGMEATTRPRSRKALLVLSLAVNLGVLAYFKYANFFLRSLEETLAAAGASASLPVLKLILPFGISFYTFEAISYTVDVYRRRVPPERSLANFLVFILFFPHLIAGPIVRARDFLPQIRRPKRWDWSRMELGVQYFLLGLLKKLVIADRMALYADPVFAAPQGYSSFAVWAAVLAYALQVYADFSGYSDMALGTAHLLGYKLTKNFAMPYLSANIAEFWRRWHMSLSSWLRDYVFIPLGGSRVGKARHSFNLMVTMTLCGLWHGASWTFVLFGALHGLLLIGHTQWRTFCKRRTWLDGLQQSAPGTAVRVLVTFLVVALTFVVFRAPRLSAAGAMLARLARVTPGVGPPVPDPGLWYTLVLVLVCHLVVARGWWNRLALRLPGPVAGLAYAGLLSLALMLTPDLGKAFIYFQF